MLDIKLLRKDLPLVQEKLLKRRFELDVDQFNELESQRKEMQSSAQELQAQRNKFSKAIGIAKGKGEDASELLTSMTDIKKQLDDAEEKSQYYQQAINDLVLGIPNLLDSSVPEGTDESENQEIDKSGEIPSFNFSPKDHIELGESLNGIDTDAAVKLTGSRFAVMSGGIAKLQRALIQFMLDTHTEQHGYQETYVPYIVNSDSLMGTGQLPKFSEDLFKLENTDYHLIPTSEVPLTNLVRDKLLSEKELPLKYVAHTPCFRSEAGSYGRDTRGLIRQHQFEKVELVHIVEADKSWQALEELVGHAEAILKALELPYRKMLLCAGDTGFSSAKTYDLEVWLPSQECYREISSCSNMLDFQARRMKARYKSDSQAGKPELVHTLNGSGLAAGRTLIAVMENYQQADGSILIPAVLKPYFGKEDCIRAT